MSKDLVKIGDKLMFPFPNFEKYEGVIMDIDEYVADPRIKYKVGFDELNVIMFFSENMIRKVVNEK